jgi:phosphoglycolate phosphatase-like HAD superfamily hydrolase
LNVRREATLYIGDSEVDMGTARSSGVRFVAYKNSALEADGSIDDHLALLEFLSDG